MTGHFAHGQFAHGQFVHKYYFVLKNLRIYGLKAIYHNFVFNIRSESVIPDNQLARGIQSNSIRGLRIEPLVGVWAAKPPTNREVYWGSVPL